MLKEVGSDGTAELCTWIDSVTQMAAAPHVDGFKLAAAKVALCSCSGR